MGLFVLGLFVGTAFGVFLMCLFQINRDEKENEKFAQGDQENRSV